MDLIFAVLVPENMCGDYIQHLPTLAENLVDKSLCKQLRAAKSADEIWGIFSHYDQCEAEEREANEENTASLVQESDSEE